MKTRSQYVVYNLKETYYDHGVYDFKIVLDSKFFKNGHGLTFDLRDSLGKPMRYSAEIWGRKVNCQFVFDETVPDGVCVGHLYSPEKTICKINFWTVGP